MELEKSKNLPPRCLTRAVSRDMGGRVRALFSILAIVGLTRVIASAYWKLNASLRACPDTGRVS